MGGLKLDEKNWWFIYYSHWSKNVFSTIVEGKDFFNYLGFGPLNFFAASQILPSPKYQSNFKKCA